VIGERVIGLLRAMEIGARPLPASGRVDPLPSHAKPALSRQQRRRALFQESLHVVNRANAKTGALGRARFDRGGNVLYDLSRQERRNLARGYAAKEWRAK
jgi:hypothetical protein